MALDRQYDVDVLAKDGAGRSVLVAHRQSSPEFPYRTITIRSRSDQGNDDVQLAKLLDGRSRADIYVQSYEGWVVSSPTPILRAAVVRLSFFGCQRHPYEKQGRNGQWLVQVCEACCADLRVHLRPLTAVA
jgi:hypothetical protein